MKPFDQRHTSQIRTAQPLTCGTVLGSLLGVLPLTAQAVPLTFDQMVGLTTGNSLLGPTAGERTLYFTDVATENGQTIDARISTTIIGDTHFADQVDPNAVNYFGDAGYIPDYGSREVGPQDDLGFLYYGNGINGQANGIATSIDFFNGTGEMAGTFMDLFTVSCLEIAIYDVDGEASQSEYFSAFLDDGLIAYATGTSPQALVATELQDSVLFEGPGTNFSETDATGAAILYYELTSSLNLNFGSVQSSGPQQNAVFSAIDGDLSLFPDGGFGDPTAIAAVPLPAGALLLLTAIGGCFVTSRRSSKTKA